MARRTLIDPQRASRELRAGLGGIASGGGTGAESDSVGEPSSFLGDTTQVEAADRFGNFVAATPSGGWIGSSPVIAGLGFPLGTRGQMVSLDPALGDVDLDGQVTLEDVAAVERHLQGEAELSPLRWKAADYDGDGRIDSADRAAILVAVARGS